MVKLNNFNVLAIWGLAGLVSGGCGELRPLDGADRPVTYQNQVKSLLAARCVSCHKPSSAAGRYDLSSYRGVLGPGSDARRNVVVGDGASRLLTKLDSVREPAHWGYLLPKAAQLSPGQNAAEQRDADLALLRAWVVEDQLAYSGSSVHPPGWVNPTDRNSEAFHGGALRGVRWDDSGCRVCHGAQLQGGVGGGGRCSSCHLGGTQSCTTCHGSSSTLHGSGTAAPPVGLSGALAAGAAGVGAHTAHLSPRAGFAAVLCADCHTVPSSSAAAGHLFDSAAARSTDLRAEVTLGGAAAQGGVKPSYDRTSGRCTVYCHGATLATSGQNSRPSWTDSLGDGCDGCHGMPPTQVSGGKAHSSSTNCAICHSSAYTAAGARDTASHINGTVEL